MSYRLKFISLVFVIILAINNSNGQPLYGHIPEINRIDWTKSGLTLTVPVEAGHIIYVDDMSGTSDYDKVMNAILTALTLNSTELVIIKFSANRTYSFSTTIELNNSSYSNIVFQGEGSTTILSFDGINPAFPSFRIKGQTTTISSMLSNPINMKSQELIFQNSLELDHYNIGDWIHFYEHNYPVVNTSSYPNIVGQITRITGKNSSALFIYNEAARSYDINHPESGDQLIVRKIDPIKHIGFENFTIKRINSDDANGGSTFVFEYAVSCWIRGIESIKTSEHHLVARYCSNLEISGNFFSHAYSYGGGGRGYGVNLKSSTSNCLVENNIFNTLRHAIVLEMGANSNVITYNLSNDQYSTTEYYINWPNIKWEDWQDKDIILHGRYPFCNLFEHNWCEEIAADNIWGSHGPYNVFLRNMCQNKYGTMKWMRLHNAPNTSVLGNKLSRQDYISIIIKGSTSFIRDIYGKLLTDDPPCSYNYATTCVIKHNDYAVWGHVYENYLALYDYSYFYSEDPYFLEGSYSFPSIGPAIQLQNIPAKDRFNQSVKTYNQFPTKPPIFVTLDQKNLQNLSFGQVANWRTNLWDYKNVPYEVIWRINSNQMVKADINLNSFQKFKDWNSNTFLNHNQFTILEDLSIITAHHKPSDLIGISTILISGGSGGSIQFKDPWLRDYDEAPYGLRNRGMEAPYKSRTSPFSPDYTTPYNGDVYQGVFLNQGYPGWNPPYYSVGAPAMQTIPFHGQSIEWYFQGWEGTNVQFQNAGASQTPIVFLNSGAEARAIYKGNMASSKARATGYPNKRNLAYQETVQANWLHLVYVDGGGIWYSRYSSENSVWIARTGLRPGHGR